MGSTVSRLKELATKTPEKYLTTEEIHAELGKLGTITDSQRRLFTYAMKEISVEWLGFRENCRVVIYLPHDKRKISIGKEEAVNVLIIQEDETGEISSTWESSEGLLTAKLSVMEAYVQLESTLKLIGTSLINSAVTGIGSSSQKKLTD